MAGGALSRPAERFPNLFGDNKFLKEYPYFLPCAVPATLSVVAWLGAFCFLKEVCESPMSYYAIGLVIQPPNRLTLHRRPFWNSFVERKDNLG